MLAVAISNRVGKTDNKQAGVCAFYFADSELFGEEVDGELFGLHGGCWGD